MKIYFTAAISHKDKYGDQYEKIVKNLRNLGHDVIADHILYSSTRKIQQETREEKAAHYRQVARWIGAVDLVVAEVTEPSSVNVGFELSQSLDRNKPVIALYQSEHDSAIFDGISESKILIAGYDPPELDEILQELLEEVRMEMEVRFNFYLPASLNYYLEEMAGSQDVSKAEFLRRLLEKHREEQA